jgi:hypothetical protein
VSAIYWGDVIEAMRRFREANASASQALIVRTGLDGAVTAEAVQVDFRQYVPTPSDSDHSDDQGWG